MINPESLPQFTEAPSNKRKTILFKTDSSKSFLNEANIACFKSGPLGYQMAQLFQKTS